jgi:SET domain-containing protein
MLPIICDRTGTGTLLGGEQRKYLAAILGMEWDVDAEKCGNESRYINHYSNIANQENACLLTVFCEDGPHVLVFVTQCIPKGEEILLDYGPSYHGTVTALSAS